MKPEPEPGRQWCSWCGRCRDLADLISYWKVDDAWSPKRYCCRPGLPEAGAGTCFRHSIGSVSVHAIGALPEAGGIPGREDTADTRRPAVPVIHTYNEPEPGS